MHENVDPAAYVEKHGLKMDNDSDAIKGIVETVVANNPQSVADYKAGKEESCGIPRRTGDERNKG